jgi:Peptidase family M28
MSRRPRGPKAPPTAPADHARRLLLGVGVWLALFALARSCALPPPARAVDAPEHLFSAGRAAEVLDRLIAEPFGPHPTGSDAAGVLQERLAAEFDALGWEHEEQVAMGLGPGGACGRMHNFMARRLGKQRDLPAVMMVAHYDSVGAGPGIADDLAGVAALFEAARALGQRTPGEGRPERTVILLLTDGEEAGLIGAEAFMHSHPWAEDVGLVFNLEARGVSGPSFMFQTGSDNASLVNAFASAADRPNADSVSVEVYRRMPNDTDFSVFLRRGLTGLNFAFIGDWFAYHTPLDDRAHLSLASVQHQGDQLLAALHAAESWRGDTSPGGDVVYGTLFGRWVPSMSVAGIRAAALLALLGLLWSVQRAARRGRIGWWRTTVGLLWVPVCVAVPAALAYGYGEALRALTGTWSPWHGSPSPSWIALIGGLVLCLCFLGWLGARFATPLGFSLAVWTWWGLAGLFTSLFLPGASYLFVWPALGLAALSNVFRLGDAALARAARVALFSLVLSVPLWAPVTCGLISAFGLDVPLLPMVVLAVQGTLMLPLVGAAPGSARWSLGGLGFACLVFGVVMTVVLPHESTERPGRLNLVYAADAGGDRWLALDSGAPLPGELEDALDWKLDRGVWSAPAPRLAWPLPVFEDVTRQDLGDGRVLVSGTVRSFAFAARTLVEFVGPWRVESLRVEGRDLGRTRRARLVAAGSEGYRLQLELSPLFQEGVTVAGAGPPILRLVDRVHGLPPEGAFLDDGRGPTFVPTHDGDGLVLTSRVSLDL